MVETILRKSGHSLTKLAEKLSISRNTLYNRCKNANLSYDFIMEIGNIICYDFTIDFPEMKEKIGLASVNPALQHGEDQSAALWRLEGKYTQLLEKYNKLLEIVISVVDVNGLHSSQQKIAQMLEKGGKG
jgi:hypothetical protein